jgi:type III restriction enzyme
MRIVINEADIQTAKPYQTDATMAVVRCLEGQCKGFRKEDIGRTGLFAGKIFSNKKLEITETDILKKCPSFAKRIRLKNDQPFGRAQFYH